MVHLLIRILLRVLKMLNFILLFMTAALNVLVLFTALAPGVLFRWSILLVFDRLSRAQKDFFLS
jgi:hypothetical protein